MTAARRPPLAPRLPLLAAVPDFLRRDRERRGFTIGQVAWRLGGKPQEYRELEAGARSPDLDTWDRICKLYGWPQTFVDLAGDFSRFEHVAAEAAFASGRTDQFGAVGTGLEFGRRGGRRSHSHLPWL
jgi:hypothetical protein